MKDKAKSHSSIFHSGFVRSMITRALAIFIIASIIISVFAFLSFTSEIRNALLSDRQKKLTAAEETFSDRMEEVTSIAYNIGTDPNFYFDKVENDPASDREMADILSYYLVGNSFIEHLAFCRTSDPDTIYTARGVRSLHEFFKTSMGMNDKDISPLIENIQKDNTIRIAVNGGGDDAYFTYSYPLPQFAPEPKAHVLMMIPVSEVRPLLETLLIDSNGSVAIFDANDKVIYSFGNEEDKFDLTDYVKNGSAEENYKSPSGQKYVLQKIKSQSNNWTYVSAMRFSDAFTGLAHKQIIFIAAVLVLLIGAVAIMLISIIRQFKPINKLAAEVAGKNRDDNTDASIVDERLLLSNTIASLKDDSEQKQMYQTAFYEAEAASKAKSAFLSSMSHDIRTPMNAIVGMTALARKHIDDRNYVDDCLKKVQMSSDYLLDIINNVLDMSRIESGRIPIAKEPLLIPAMIDSLVSLMTSSIEAKSQTIDVDITGIRHPAVIGDNVHIVQVFVNILSNAVKFTPENGKLHLKATQTDSDDPQYGRYIFAFSDTGVGMPPEFIEHVFDTFSRADESISSSTEGTGLGMAIAKKLVELMDGTITCESELGRGTTFTVTMQMKYADKEEAISAAATSEKAHDNKYDATVVDFTGKRILLVDDNTINREIARKIISETGAEVIDACNGKEAVEIFESSPIGYYDLIFMDIQMPVLNGYDATAAIRAMNRGDAVDVPIYAMSANTFDEDIRRIKNAGMNGHIAKPYTPPMLYRILKKVLNK